MNRGPSKWEQIELNDLPKYSPWPDRIFGVSDWSVPNRDINKVLQEYDKNKYKDLLEYQDRNKIKDTKEIRKRQLLGRSWQFAPVEQTESHTVVSQNGTLYLAPVLEAQWYNDNLLSSVFEDILGGGESVIELGAGYGYNLHVLSQRFTGCDFIGGELSENAITLGDELYAETSNINLTKFNYYDKEYDLLENEFDTDVVLFTRLSIEQLPECSSIIDRVLKYKSQIDTVVHFEPVYELYDEETLLGLLRRKYTEINDYNRDLRSALEDHEEVEIQKTEYDIFGDNGLCPMSLIQWKPK